MINKHTIITLFFLVSFGCENPNSEDNEEEEIVVLDIVSSDVNEEPYYYNFHENLNDSTDWQLMYHNQEIAGTGYSMPNISLDSTKVMFAVDSVMVFDDIIDSPSMSSFMNSVSDLNYLGKYEILSYDMTVHKVSTSNLVYFIYDINSHQVFKLFFNDYSAGVISFKYAELHSNNIHNHD